MPPKKKEAVTSDTILSVINDLQKKYPQNMNTEKTSTGILPLDFLLKGGYISPMFTEIAGESGTGKSTLALSLARSLIRKGHKVLYLNFEQAVIQKLIQDMGMDKLDPASFCVLAPATISEGEECLKETCYITDEFEKPYFDHVFFDSVGGMVPDYIEDKDIDSTDNTPAIKARQLSKFFEANTHRLKRRGINCWFVNHLSLKIETDYGKKSEKKSKGGNAVKYYTDTWLYLEHGANLNQQNKENNPTGGYCDKDYYCNVAYLSIAKGRTGGMLKKTECPIFFGKGISNSYWIYLILKNAGYIKTNGSYLKCTLLDEDGVNNQGISKTVKYIQENQKAVIAKMKAVGLWNFLEEGEVKTDDN